LIARHQKVQYDVYQFTTEKLQEFAKKNGFDYILNVTISGSANKYTIMMRFYSVQHDAYGIYNAEINDKSQLPMLLENIAFNIAIKSGDVPANETIRLCPISSDHKNRVNLMITTEPEGTDIYLDNIHRGVSPITINDLPIGSHNLRLTHKYYYDSTSTIVLNEEECNSLHYILRKRKTGIIRINIDFPGARVTIDGVHVGEAPGVFRNIEYGRHFVNVQAFPSNYNETVEIVNDNVVDVNAVFNVYIDITGTPKGADVFINNKRLGSIPLKRYKINPGYYDLIIRKPGYETEKIFLIAENNNYAKFNIQLKQRSLIKAMIYSSILPGLGQVYSEKSKINFIYSVLEIGALAYIYQLNNSIKNQKKDYNDLINTYEYSHNVAEIVNLHPIIEKKYDEILDTESLRNKIIYTSIGIWVLNLLDMFIRWPFGNTILDYKVSIQSNSKVSISFPLN
jgi:hypothetical protein